MNTRSTQHGIWLGVSEEVLRSCTIAYCDCAPELNDTAKYREAIFYLSALPRKEKLQ